MKCNVTTCNKEATTRNAWTWLVLCDTCAERMHQRQMKVIYWLGGLAAGILLLALVLKAIGVLPIG